MAASFNSRTAFAADWRYMDPEEIEDGILYRRTSEGVDTGETSSLKCNLESVASSELAAMAGPLGLNPDDTLCTCWLAEPNSGDPAPQSQDAIVIAGVTWVVQRVIDNLGGQWQCVVATAGSRELLGQF
jgi:hypothetical protein